VFNFRVANIRYSVYFANFFFQKSLIFSRIEDVLIAFFVD